MHIDHVIVTCHVSLKTMRHPKNLLTNWSSTLKSTFSFWHPLRAFCNALQAYYPTHVLPCCHWPLLSHQLACGKGGVSQACFCEGIHSSYDPPGWPLIHYDPAFTLALWYTYLCSLCNEGDNTASYRWVDWVWEMIGWSSRILEIVDHFRRN